MTKLVLLDYNGTIVPNDPNIRPYHLIIESIFGKEMTDEFKSPNRSKTLLRDKHFPKGKFKEYFTKFKEESDLYKTFQESKNPEILEVLSLFDKYLEKLNSNLDPANSVSDKASGEFLAAGPEKKFPSSELHNKFLIDILKEKSDEFLDYKPEDFIFEIVIYPLMALYNVHIANVEPFTDVSDFFAKNTRDDICIAINSDSPHTVLLIELQEYAKMEEYSFFKPLLEEGCVYGNTNASKKADKDRVKIIISDLQAKGILNGNLEEIEVIGDAKSDIESFEVFESVAPTMRPKINLTLTMENYLMLIPRLEEMCIELANDQVKLESTTKKLEKIKDESNKLKDRLEELKEKFQKSERGSQDKPEIKVVDSIRVIDL